MMTQEIFIVVHKLYFSMQNNLDFVIPIGFRFLSDETNGTVIVTSSLLRLPTFLFKLC